MSQITRFDTSECLTDTETIARFLTISLAEDNPNELIDSLQVVARSRGMSQLAQDAGVSRESLYKSLSGDANPRYGTIHKLLKALGVTITITPKKKILEKKVTTSNVKAAVLKATKPVSKKATKAKLVKPVAKKPIRSKKTSLSASVSMPL